MLLALLAACSCSDPDAPQEVAYPAPALQEVGGRFRGETETPIDPQVAFAVQSRCPRVERARLRKVNAQIREVTVWGTGLDTVERIGAALPDGKLANVHFEAADGGLRFPVACDACQVYLGVAAGDRTAACFGPGYSLTLHDGRLARPADR